LNCQGVIREISNYLDGEMDAALKQEIAMIVNQTKMTVELFCYSEAVELPTDVRSRLHEALHHKLRRPGN
jgi:hypothetical protein